MSQRAYRINVASQLSGVSTQLIRAWERRYGVLHPQRTPSGYRTYTDADIEVLKRLKRLTEEGVAVGEAIRLLPDIVREVKKDVDGRHGATKKAATPAQLERWRDEILLAAQKLDQARLDAVVSQAAASMTPIAFFDQLLAPLLREVGEQWHAGTLSIPEEHLVTQAARQRLIVLITNAPRGSMRHVICACPPHEEHEVGLLGAALHFRHAGWRVTFLGARTPVEHLARVARALKPDLIALSIVNDAGVPALLGTLSRKLPEGTRVLLGGAGALPHRSLAKKHGFDTFAGKTADWRGLLKEAR